MLMNRAVIIFFVLALSGCQVFKIKKKFSKKHLNKVTIYANTKTELPTLKSIKLKTKINIFKDSIIVSASPILGIEVVKLTVTDQVIYIDQKFQNKKDSLAISDIDPKFKIKGIKKFIMKPKKQQDTTIYTNPHINCLFTNYTNKNNLFLPQKIIFWTTPDVNNKTKESQIEIDYKSIIFSSKKKK